MTRFHLRVSTLLLLGSLGCATTPKGGGMAVEQAAVVEDDSASVPKIRVLGILAESSACTNPLKCTAFGYTDFDLTTVSNGPIGPTVPPSPGQPIVTRQIVKISIAQTVAKKTFKYDAFLGPNPGSSKDVRGWLKNSEPTIVLDTDGWVLLAGAQPRVKSDWVSAGADGSTIVLHREDGDLQRFFYLDGGTNVKATVSCIEDPTKTRELGTPGTYINILSGCVFEPPGKGESFDIAIAALEVKDFVKYVKAVKKAAI